MCMHTHIFGTMHVKIAQCNMRILSHSWHVQSWLSPRTQSELSASWGMYTCVIHMVQALEVMSRRACFPSSRVVTMFSACKHACFYKSWHTPRCCNVLLKHKNRLPSTTQALAEAQAAEDRLEAAIEANEDVSHQPRHATFSWHVTLRWPVPLPVARSL